MTCGKWGLSHGTPAVRGTLSNPAPMIPVYENYEGYQPPWNVRATVARILSDAPQQYLSGLGALVLTNSAVTGQGKTRRVAGKRYPRRECLGFYHPKLKGEQAWIEIVVDNVVNEWFGRGKAQFMSRIPVLRNMAFANVLYHEVGHHLEHTIGAPARSGESAAEAWNKRLLRSYFRRRYWYLVPLLGVAKAIVARMGALRDRASRSS